MRLFTALWPPSEATSALAAEVGELPPGWRILEPSTWHVTLAFHGEADPGVLALRLDAAVPAVRAPRLRLAGAGAFEGVRWAGVEADGPLRDLVEAAGGDVDRFVAHLTVSRAQVRAGPPAEPDAAGRWSTHVGPWWRPSEVLLVASGPGPGGARFPVVHRVSLSGG